MEEFLMNLKQASIILITVIAFFALRSIDVPDPFKVMKANRNLTHEELVRAIRLMVSAEYEAIQLYTQVAESTDNALAKKVLLEIADEERVHAGEFLKLLNHLAPDEEKLYKEGAKEVEEIQSATKKQAKEKNIKNYGKNNA